MGSPSTLRSIVGGGERQPPVWSPSPAGGGHVPPALRPAAVHGLWQPARCCSRTPPGGGPPARQRLWWQARGPGEAAQCGVRGCEMRFGLSNYLYAKKVFWPLLCVLSDSDVFLHDARCAGKYNWKGGGVGVCCLSCKTRNLFCWSPLLSQPCFFFRDLNARGKVRWTCTRELTCSQFAGASLPPTVPPIHLPTPGGGVRTFYGVSTRPQSRLSCCPDRRNGCRSASVVSSASRWPLRVHHVGRYRRRSELQ